MEITERLFREFNEYSERDGLPSSVGDVNSREEYIDILMRRRQQSMQERMIQLRTRLNECLVSLNQIRLENQALLLQQQGFLFHVQRTARDEYRQG